mgnify:FL=1
MTQIDRLRELQERILDNEHPLAKAKDDLRVAVAETLENYFGPIRRAFDATNRVLRTEQVYVGVHFSIRGCTWEATSADVQIEKCCETRTADDPLTAMRLAVQALGETLPEEADALLTLVEAEALSHTVPTT